jgi:hypothetical protein
MDNKNTPPSPNGLPWYRKPADRPKIPKTFNIYKEHSEILQKEYKENSSALIRFLMDKFFSPEGEGLRNEFEVVQKK